jgi:hypothetical protein
MEDIGGLLARLQPTASAAGSVPSEDHRARS